MLILTLAVIIPIVSSTNVDYVDSKCRTLDAGWTVTHNDKVYENVTWKKISKCAGIVTIEK